MLDAVAAGRVASPRQVDPRASRELDAVVRRARAWRSEARHPTVRALVDDLDAWAERRPLPHVGSRLDERLGKFAERNRRTLRAVGAIVFLGLGVTAVGAWRYAVDTRDARDRATAEATRAGEAERRALTGEVAAEVALADPARLDGRIRDAAAAVDRAGVADLALHPWGEGAVAAPDGQWWTFWFGEPGLRAERPWPGPPLRLRLVPGGRAVFAEPLVGRGGGPALWDRTTLARRGDSWFAEDTTADGTFAVVTAADGARALDLVSGNARWSIAETPFGATGVAPGDRYAWRGLVGVVRVFELATGAPVGQVIAPATQERVAASQDARLLLTWGADGTVRSWVRSDARPGHLAPEAPGSVAPDLAVSADGRILAVSGLGARIGETIELRDLATGVTLRRVSTGGPVDALAFSPDGTGLAATLDGGGVGVWDVATGAERWRWAGDTSPAPVDWVGADVVTVDRHGDLVVLAGEDGAERRRTRALAGSSWDLAVVPGTSTLVVGGYADPTAVVIDVATGQVRHRVDVGSARAQVSVTQDGALVALAGFDGRTPLLEPSTGRVRATLDATVGVVGADFSPDGRLPVTGGFEEQLVFWDVASGDRLRTESLGGMGSRVLFTPTGRLFVVHRNWVVEEVPLDEHRRQQAATEALAGGAAERAGAFAALGWWERVLAELARAEAEHHPGDPLLAAQAWLALGDLARAVEAARAAPESPYRRVLENLPLSP